jgi:signal transduction histidine kinase
LAIVYRIVSDYSGQIEVNAHEGNGTTVSVKLPARTPVAA